MEKPEGSTITQNLQMAAGRAFAGHTLRGQEHTQEQGSRSITE
jgi:hypothetical protein